MVSLPSRTAKSAAAEPAPVNAPLFRRLVESLSEERRSVVLDLDSSSRIVVQPRTGDLQPPCLGRQIAGQ